MALTKRRERIELAYGEQANHQTTGGWLWLVWLSAACVRLLAALQIRQPQIFSDELTYWQFARSFAESGKFLFHGKPFDLPAVLYSVVLSPLFLLRSDIVVFDLVRLVNVLMMAAVVFPAYGLARECLDPPRARLVAVLSVLLPGGVYSALVMPETLYFPLFVLCSWLLFRTLLRGRYRDGLIAAAVFAATFVTKPHALVLLVSYGLIMLLWGMTRFWSVDNKDRGALARELRARCAPFLGGLLVAAARVLEGKKGGGALGAIVGAYAGILKPGGEAPRPFLSVFVVLALLVVLALGSGFVAAAVASANPRATLRAGEEWRWFALMTGVITAVYVVLVARHTISFDAEPRLHERYLFVVGPLFLVLLFRSGALERVSARVATAMAGAGLMALVLIRPNSVLTWNIQSDAPSLTGFFLLWRHLPSRWMLTAAVALVVGCALWTLSLLARRPSAGVMALGGLLVVFNVGWYREILETGNDLSTRHLVERVRREMEPGDRLAVVVDGLDRRIVWALEFWIREPVHLYGSDRSSDFRWWLESRGPMEEASAATGATLLVASSALEAPLMSEGGVTVQRVSSLTPAILLRIRPRKDFDEASFETNPARIRVAYAARQPLRTLALDELGSLVLEVKNLGDRTWRAQGESPLRFGYHWSDPDRTGSWQSVVWDDGSRIPLGRNVRRGESAEIVLRVKSPPSAGPTWRIVVAPVLEGSTPGWAVDESQTYVGIVDVRSRTRKMQRSSSIRSPPAVSRRLGKPAIQDPG